MAQFHSGGARLSYVNMIEGLAEERHRRVQLDHLELGVALAQNLALSVALVKVQLRDRVQRRHGEAQDEGAAEEDVPSGALLGAHCKGSSVTVDKEERELGGTSERVQEQTETETDGPPALDDESETEMESRVQLFPNVRVIRQRDDRRRLPMDEDEWMDGSVICEGFRGVFALAPKMLREMKELQFLLIGNMCRATSVGQMRFCSLTLREDVLMAVAATERDTHLLCVILDTELRRSDVFNRVEQDNVLDIS